MQYALNNFCPGLVQCESIREVSEAELDAIVDAWCKRKAIISGRFFAKSGDKWIACDNRYPTFDDGCYVEEFEDRKTAIKWLKDELEVWDLAA